MHRYIDYEISDKDDRTFCCSSEVCRKRKYFFNMPTVIAEEDRHAFRCTKTVFRTEIKVTDFKDLGLQLDDL